MIPVRNIYYMLSYAFRALNEEGFKSLASEDFENMMDLSASILIKGVSKEIKRGLNRDYNPHTESLSGIKGKIDISESIKTMAIHKKQLVCSYDEFSENSYMNRILRTTMELLIRSQIDGSRKKDLRKLLVYFSEVDSLDPYLIDWKLGYHRNNSSYEMLMGLSFMIIHGLLQSEEVGSTKLMNFREDHIHALYERFILAYFKREHPEIKASAPRINWQIDDDMDQWLPIMQTDIVLSKDNKHLIIDAKYYSKTMRKNYDKRSLHSANLYQIFSYVKNMEKEKGEEAVISGMLLYAKTDEDIVPENSYAILGNRIDVRTLDLSGDFKVISAKLDWIADNFEIK
ncbi:MAG: 5-methylcytosine-specific restriction endonuclease system specificity protein McrC [Tissierellia bacterium]|nr:5-methylcytosine-specific restriction endonuclease system specificity protein McrC [Tissierellia bacterium]